MTESNPKDDGFALISSSGEKFPLLAVTTVGRDDNCDLQIKEGLLSRQHARILIMAEQVTVEDLESTNGTFVNGKQISGSVSVSPNDEIRFDTAVYYLTGMSEASAAEDTSKTVVRPKDDIESSVADHARKAAATTPEPASTTEEKQLPMTAPPSWLDKQSETVLLSKEERLKQLGQIAPIKNIPENTSDLSRLVGISAPLAGRIFELTYELTAGDDAHQKWAVGREKGLEITIEEPSISSRHFQIVNEGQRWKVVNLMASNGTLVNGQKRLSSYLDDGDIITAGNMDFIFQLPISSGKPSKKNVSPSTIESAGGSFRLGRTIVIASVLILLIAISALLLLDVL